MVYQVAIITTIAVIMILIPVTYFPTFPAQGASTKAPLVFIPPRPHPAKTHSIVHPPGANTTTGANMTGNTTSTSNMTGAAGNNTGSNVTAAHDSSIHTAKPAGCSFLDPC
jgi:hypothetical protein